MNRPDQGLRLPELLAMGVGGMIGGGIFSILGMAVGIAGHAAPLAFAVGSLVAGAAGYSYIRLALAFHSDGASFTYLDHAFPKHPNIAGVAGWTVIVGYVGTLALYAFTFGAYGADLMGAGGSTPVRVALSAGVLLSFMAVNLLGAQATGKTEVVIVLVKVVLLGMFAFAGSTNISRAHLFPVFDRGIASPLVAGALVFVAFEGFQLITNAVMETENPGRDIPRGIYGSIAITSLIYIGVSVVAVGNLDAAELMAAKEYALAVAARPALGNLGPVLVDIAALLATASAINATIFGASRMLAEMASEDRVPRAFSHRSTAQVPWLAVVVIVGLSAAFTAAASLDAIATFSSLTFLLVSVAVSAANFRLRSQTQSKSWLVLSGIVLMGTTIALLIHHVWAENRMMLVWVGAIFVTIAVAEILFFERVTPKTKSKLPR
ncbi:MAG: amino acid transporter [Deltaproteobacteria bacterium]|nr:MAG: amino acid transporter [Deltaproteobacteria bacterium]